VNWVTTTFGAFSNARFRYLWAGSFLAFIAFFMSLVVSNVVAFDLAGNNRAVGFVGFGQGIAQLALGPLGGALADRLPKKAVIFSCQVVITITFFVLSVLVLTDVIEVIYLAIGSFVIGMSFSFLGPARQAFMVELVEPRRRGNAVALSQVALNASRVIAPFVAAILLAKDALGAEGAFALMGALYVMAMYYTLRLPYSPPAAQTFKRSVLGDIVSGVAYVARTPRLRLLISSYVLTIMFGFTYTAVLPGLLVNELDHKAKAITILLLANAVGGLIASLGVASLADSPNARIVYNSMCAIFGVSVVAMGISPSYAVLTGVMFVSGFGGGGFQTLNGAIVSHTTAPEYFGRVVSLTFLAFATSSIIALPAGFIADAYGERPTLIGAGIVVCFITVGLVALERTIKDLPALSVTPVDVAAG
jgi:MFS family permease